MQRTAGQENPVWDWTGRRIQDMEASRHKLGDEVNCSVLYAQRGPEGLSKFQGRERRVASGTSCVRQHICPRIHVLEQESSKEGAGVPQGAPQPPPPLSLHPHTLSPLAMPQCTTGMLQCGATAVAQSPGRRQGPAAPVRTGKGCQPTAEGIAVFQIATSVNMGRAASPIPFLPRCFPQTVPSSSRQNPAQADRAHLAPSSETQEGCWEGETGVAWEVQQVA